MNQNKLRLWVGATLVIGLVLSTFLLPVSQTAHAESQPAYAQKGAYAEYSVLGGFIPFFDGVNGTVSYLVTNVFQNGSFAIRVDGNFSQGNEAPMTESTFNLTDSADFPKIFPAVPISELSSKTIVFENVSVTLDKTTSVAVPAGTFNTIEFVGTNSNGTKMFYWFDQYTGIVIQMAGGGGVFQLMQSNIASPIASPSALSTDLPYIAIFASIFIVAAAAFLAFQRRYNAKGKKTVAGKKASK